VRKVTGIVSAWTDLLSLIDGIDPNTVSKESVVYNVDGFPAVTYLDIPGVWAKPLHNGGLYVRANKSLEAYNQLVCAWVRDVGVIPVQDDVVGL